MPTVTGTIRNPQDGSLATGAVVFQLVGDDGQPLPVAFMPSTNATIEGSSSVNLAAGVYTIGLPSNDLLLPAGTRWQRVHDRSGPVYLYVTPTPSTQSEEDILADAPASIGSAALSAHAADVVQHGGGTRIATVQKSDGNFVTTSATLVDVPGMSLPVVIPNRPWVLKFIGTLAIATLNAQARLEIESAGGFYPGNAFKMRSVVAGDELLVNLEIPFPNPSIAGNPTTGTVVTFKPQVLVTAGTLTVFADVPFGVGRFATFVAETR